MKPLTLVLLASLLVPACVHRIFMSEQLRHDRVHARARFDLNCQGEITIVAIDSSEDGAYGAMGCGRRARYAMRACTDTYYDTACEIALEGTVENER